MPSTNSPLRYPGGKSQLNIYISHILDINNLRHATYCEPFCGGAGVAITLLLKNKVDEIFLNDYDPAVYSVWYAILNQPEKFIDKIIHTPITLKEWYIQHEIYSTLKDTSGFCFDLAWSTFFLNRTNRSGIIGGGPIGGFNQTARDKIDCRFNKNTLINKIKKISDFNKKIHLYNNDGIEFIRKILIPRQQPMFIFFDPPYYSQGQNLYKNALQENYHVELANIIQQLNQHYWIVTYDNVNKIKQLYKNCDGWKYGIRYSANKKRKESELIYKSPITRLESYERVFLEKI